MDTNVYPCYDRVSDCLTVIIIFADTKIYSLKEQVQKSGIAATIVSLMIAFSTIGLTILSNRQERRNIEALTAREHELKDALYLAQQSSDAKKDFLSRMSHEIRTPMNIIVGMTTIAGANLEDKNRVKDCLSKIAFSSKHLLSLINDILDMSKIEEGKLTVNNELFRLPRCLRRSFQRSTPRQRQRGACLNVNLMAWCPIRSLATPCGSIRFCSICSRTQ